jgi:hypothetical protein
VKHHDLFFEFLHALERFPPERPFLPFSAILSCCYQFFNALRNPVEFIIADSPDPDPQLLSSMAPLWAKTFVSLDLFCIGDRPRDSVLDFVNAVNGSIAIYQGGVEDLAFDLVRQLTCPRDLFTVMDIHLSKSLQFAGVAGRGIVPSGHIFMFAKLRSMTRSISR